MTPLVLNLLGAFEVTVATTSPTGRAFATDKVRALLAYLALEPAQAHRRETLAALFWPEINHQSALTNLRQTFHRLRDGLERVAPGSSDALFTVTKQTMQLNQTALTVDAIRFTTLLAASERHAHADLATCEACLERLGQAVALYRGELLAGFGLGDAAPFEEWLLLRRELYQQQALLALQKLTDAHEQRGDDDQAHTYASRQVALDPYREEAHRQLMRLLALRGLTSQALTQYERCCQLLRDELGVPPADETVALMEQIRTGRLDKVTRWQGDKVTSDKVTNDKVTSDKVQPPRSAEIGSPLGAKPHPVTLSPGHPVIPHNLPAQLTPLIGRATAVTALCERLADPAVRCLTIVGAGGMGKTRLALAVGQTFLAAATHFVAPDPPLSTSHHPPFPDGIFFISLAALPTAAAVAPAIGAVLGLTLPGDPQAALLQAMRARQMLLILDNFEHLLDAAALVVELLQAAPGVRILATSRERLNVRGEHLYLIPTLDYDQTPASVTTADDLVHAHSLSSVQLFTQSAQQVQAAFAVDVTNGAALLRICRLVQGMPLGLELAAAWVGTLSLTEIADAISQSGDFLASDWRDIPERQRSLRAVFEWSWRLLTPTEQQVLSQLALFQGGFTRTAAQAVAGASLPVLTRLVHKSLAQWTEGAQPSTGGRYTVHELLRQFAAEKLAQAPAIQAAAQRAHCRFYLHYLAEQTPRLVGREIRAAGAAIQQELDNIRQAWAWAPTSGEIVALDGAVYGWWQFCSWRSLTTELRQSLRVAVQEVRVWLTKPETVADAQQQRTGQRLLSKLVAIYANLLFAQGVDEEMADKAEEAIALGQVSGDTAGEAMGYFVLGRAYQEFERTTDAIAMWQKSLALALAEEQRPEPSLMTRDMARLAHTWLRGAAMALEDFAGAREHMRQALQISRTLGNRAGELNCLINLAWIDVAVGDYAAAQQGFTEGFTLAGALEHRWGEMATGIGLGEMARLQGKYLQALAWWQRSLTVAAEYSRYGESMLLSLLVRLHSHLGDQASADATLQQVFQILEQHRLPKDCQRQGLLAAAVKAYCGGDMATACAYAEQVRQLTGPGDIIVERAAVLVILGHAQVGAGQLAAAADSYQEALGYYHKVGDRGSATEAQAGLAQVALAQGDLRGAQQWVVQLLPVLAAQPRAGFNSPFFAYLACYRVLAANQDERAPTILEQGWRLLLDYAAAIPDPALRRSFLEGVAVHRELQALHEAAGSLS
ncbi:MAG: hypothetical protein DYG89_47155 [Caldilinea sp. CFX5]|nr:hypothetical protein [Caldilinea sp. CFX5]